MDFGRCRQGRRSEISGIGFLSAVTPEQVAALMAKRKAEAEAALAKRKATAVAALAKKKAETETILQKAKEQAGIKAVVSPELPTELPKAKLPIALIALGVGGAALVLLLLLKKKRE
jgi:hypothetical protein